MFYRPESKSLKISNHGNMPIDFEVNDDFLPISKECDQNYGRVIVSPLAGTINPFSEVDIKITYQQRYPGFFKKKFTIQVSTCLFTTTRTYS